MNAQELLDSVEVEYNQQEIVDRNIAQVCKKMSKKDRENNK